MFESTSIRRTSYLRPSTLNCPLPIIQRTFHITSTTTTAIIATIAQYVRSSAHCSTGCESEAYHVCSCFRVFDSYVETAFSSFRTQCYCCCCFSLCHDIKQAELIFKYFMIDIFIFLYDHDDLAAELLLFFLSPHTHSIFTAIADHL